MCGIVGIHVPDHSSPAELRAEVTRMAAALQHRGPDDAGAWVAEDRGVALAHRRLSIIDLSEAGHQPMASRSGRFTLVFNGEIYNHLDIRAELASAGYVMPWRGHSDTETLLAAFEVWGVEAALQRTVGMFALAAWDARDEVLLLARDRFGEKPLYYGWAGDAFVFASELKALRVARGFRNAVCREALEQFLRFLYVPAPLSIYEGIFKLEPGCILTLHGKPPSSAPATPLRPPSSHGGVSVRRWWSLAAAVEAAAEHRFKEPGEAIEALKAQLRETIQLQSLSDVPLGAFLSGGVDSSTIVAAMQEQASTPVKTFTVAFDERAYDESAYACAVARHLGTNHTEVRVTSREAQSVIPGLPHTYDEPFADHSQIPTYLLCQAARRHVTVALSGDAGDELFGGYNRYVWGPAIWRKIGWAPHALRRGMGKAMRAIPSETWDTVGGVVNTMRRGNGGIAHMGQKAHKLGVRLEHATSVSSLYATLVSEWNAGAAPLTRAAGRPTWSTVLSDPAPQAARDDASRMMYWDAMTYLPDDILCKVDRAAMAVSLETRVPFLDHRMAELAWRLPLSMKIRGTQGKWALRQLLYERVPRELIERPKTGFAVPLHEWLRGPLRAWAESLLQESRLEREGYFDPQPVRLAWRQHLSGSHDWTGKLWSILMFQAWLEANP